MLTLGLLNFRDAGAALVRDGRIVAAAEEERFVRIKHVTALPLKAVRSCLEQAGATLADVETVAVPWKYWQVGRRARLAVGAMLRSPTLFRVKSRRSAERLTQEWMEQIRLAPLLRETFGPCPARVQFLDHHLCHAASAFFLSPFERAAVLIADGASESHTAMLALGEGTRLTPLARIPLPHSLGQFYAAMTAFLGFRPDQDEYIVMGLAAYGKPIYADTIRRHILSPTADGMFRLDTRVLDFHLARVGIFVPALTNLLGPNRQTDEPLTERHQDIAASAQLVLEEILLGLARCLKRLTGESRLCLAGGVAFNCVANARIQREAGFQEVYVQPAAGDAGAALGAALWAEVRRRGVRPEPMPHVYWGPQYADRQISEALDSTGLKGESVDEPALCERVAQDLSEGKLVFWFQGRMEWGPRALGNRSLLADPRRANVRDLINDKVKLREPFRPFAPAVLEERASDYFDLPGPSPYMLFTYPVRPSARETIPAVVHVDGTARVQTVDRTSNPRFRRLLETFGRLTGVPVLLNTSFNVNEPIVCTPREAVHCFLRTQVDRLVIGNVLVKREA